MTDKARFYLLVLALGGLVVRLVIIIFVPHVDASDLDNYYWAGSSAVSGHNPYMLWRDHLAGPRADVLPFELVLLQLPLRFADSPGAIRVAFAVVDCLVTLGIGALRLPSRTALILAGMYALSPAVLVHLVVNPQDKVLLVLVVVVGVAAARVTGQWRWVLAGVLGVAAAIKWIGLAGAGAFMWERAPWRVRFGAIATVVALFIASHILYFPSWTVVYEFRAARFDGPPLHQSLANLMSFVGGYSRLAFEATSLFAMLASWYLVRGLATVTASIVLSAVAGVIGVDTAFASVFALGVAVLLSVPPRHFDRRDVLALVVANGLALAARLLIATSAPLGLDPSSLSAVAVTFAVFTLFVYVAARGASSRVAGTGERRNPAARVHTDRRSVPLQPAG